MRSVRQGASHSALIEYGYPSGVMRPLAVAMNARRRIIDAAAFCRRECSRSTRARRRCRLTGRLPSPEARMGTLPGGLISDVAVDVGVDDVLPGRVEFRKCSAEFVPVLGRVHIEERIADAVVECPAQRDLARLAGNKVGDDRAVARESPHSTSHPARLLRGSLPADVPGLPIPLAFCTGPAR